LREQLLFAYGSEDGTSSDEIFYEKVDIELIEEEGLVIEATTDCSQTTADDDFVVRQIQAPDRCTKSACRA